MKQEIICPKHFQWWKNQIGKYPMESIAIKTGQAKRQMICDSCDALINEGDECGAVSVVLPGQTSYAWESEFIEQTGELKK